MRWTAPPERREILLVLVSVTVYLFAYNLETSLSLVGIDPIAAQGAVFSRLGLGKTKVLAHDGRKPHGWRDRLELDIFGSWRWDEGHVAGDGAERSQGKGSGRHGAQWIRRDTVSDINGGKDGLPMTEALRWWMDEIPLVQVVKHVPGYSILDNVILFNGTVYLVTDDTSKLPPVKSILETFGSGFQQWQILTKDQGLKRIGKYGGIIEGVSWMATNPSPHNSTLFDLWRLYSTLDPGIDAQGRTSLPPPHRLILPHSRFFTDPNPPFDQHWIRRRRIDTGFHPYLAKAAFPHLSLQYFEDWEDYHKMQVPFVFERLVIADRRAAASSVNKGQPVNSPPFGLEASRWWWEPIRRTLAIYFDRLEGDGKSAEKGFWPMKSKSKKVVTYIDRQTEASENGESMIVPEDHERLLRALRKLARDRGYEFHSVSTTLDETSWEARMDVIVRSTVVLGAHGDHLLDSVWMRPSSKSTLMEFFPENNFVLSRELAARSVGINYVAWWGNRHFLGKNLPAPTIAANRRDPIHVDADAVVREVHAILSREEA